MPIYDTFTKRKRRAARAGQAEIYRYDQIPDALRTQVAYLMRDTMGGYQEVDSYSFHEPPASNGRWQAIRDMVARERGVVTLSHSPRDNPADQVMFSLMAGSADEALEVIEIAFRVIDGPLRQLAAYERRAERLKQTPDDAIAELNERFREHGIGYRYHDGVLVRIDSEVLHAEATLPALRLLHTHGFDGALEEFMSAHEHYRRGETKDANVDALNALESTLKTICDQRRWKYSGGANASDLIRIVMGKGLIPSQLQTQFEHLLKAMQTGLPPMRNNYGGHGQGSQVTTVEDHLAAYSLHLLASNIVLLIEAHQALPK